MQGGPTSVTAAVLRALGHPGEPGYAARLSAAGVGEVRVSAGGAVSWTEATYRWHGRPRWRRVRSSADAVQDVTTGRDRAVAAYEALSAGRLGEPVEFATTDEYGLRHDVLLVPVAPGVALVSALQQRIPRMPAAPVRRRRPPPAPLPEPPRVAEVPTGVETPPAASAPAAAATVAASPPIPPRPVPAEPARSEPAPEPAPLPTPVPTPAPAAAAPLPPDDSWLELLEASPVPMAVLDATGRFAEVNEALCALTGRRRDELAVLRLEDVTPQAPERSDDADVPVRRPDGGTCWARVAYADAELGGTTRRLVTFEDVTAAHETEARLRTQALHDELTGLPNRRLLVEQLTHALSRSRRTASKLGVFFIDVDDLKRVNDTHGHSGGDTLILTVGRSLREALRESDMLARIGGDEFVAVCEDVGEGRTLDEIGQRVISSVGRPLLLDGASVPVSISVGVAVPQSADEDAETLLRRADSAMYRAKSAGGGRLWGGTGRWNTAVDNRPNAQEWMDAIARGQVRLLYQPVVTAADGVLLGVAGALRWQHPEHGELTGADLLESRDAAGVTPDLVRWAVRRALTEVRTLGDVPLRVWLTVPSRALLQSGVAEEIGDAYDELGGRRAPSLVLDIREPDLAALLRRGGPPDSLAALTAAGPVSVGISGFRGDALPLGVLPDLAPRSLRLHPRLVRAAATREQPAARALLEGIVASAAAAGVTTIAVSVDDLEMLRAARECGILGVQGTVVAEPSTIDALAAVLHTRVVDLPPTTTAPPAPAAVYAEVAETLAALAAAQPATPTVPPPAPDVAPAVPAAEDPWAWPEPLVSTVDLSEDIGASLALEYGLALPGEPAQA